MVSPKDSRTVIGYRGKAFRKYPFVRWPDLKPHIEWKQGEHALTVGGTGTGKSTVAGEFLPKRTLTVVCVSKGMDPIFQGPYYKDYTTIGNWPPRDSRLSKVLLRPPNLKTLDLTKKNKTTVFGKMFDDILLRRGRWCICVDETHYMSETLSLRGAIEDMMEQGRSADISMWNNTQRPSGNSLSVYVNSRLFFLFQSQEEYDLKRLGNMTNKYTNRDELLYNITELESFETHEHTVVDRAGRIPPVRTIVELKRG